ncbi:hypothetical protein LJR231_001543 [Phyllobacterium sp. LjRoot231]|uniref:hypothetical protein n=1 Tax=Phyllobacterium sp. LjRoot231 TaxID=3342289 RepID=UPI003ECE326F
MSHSNIHHPDGRDERMRQRIEVAVLKARLEVTEQTLAAVQSDLESIFDRVWNQEPVELNYKCGTVIVVKGESTP